MSIRKFIATTSRQALKDIRTELGDEAVILSNRKIEGGVEIIALANDEVTKLTQSAVTNKAVAVKQVELLTRPAPIALESSILSEIKAMQSMLQQQFAVLSKNGVQQSHSDTSGLLYKMLNAGFSAELARRLLDKLVAGKMQSASGINQVLKRNLRVVSEDNDIVDKGGVYALIGPTGVGKTTTTAKLAARAVVRYGAERVALLTTDSYRIGAYEQLKIYGKILGVEVHTVKGTEDLRLTIASLHDKHLILIDTMGMGQRDGRVAEQHAMFDAVGVPSLLLLNAVSGGETLEDVVRKYHNTNVIGCIPTKLDEAVNLGAVLDVVVRHRLVMNYMTNGQCVPEDLHPINLDYLLHRAFKPAERKTPFTLTPRVDVSYAH
jgi:flagellar biosynthesis protein FlhF